MPANEQERSRPLVVEFYGDEPQALTSMVEDFPNEFTLVEAKNFDAATYTLQVVCALTSGGALTALVSVVRAHINSKQHIAIKANGIELQGLSAKDAIAVLEQFRDNLPPDANG